MSLFLQSMCMMGWKYAEENEKFIRLDFGEGDSRISMKVHAPYGKSIRVTFQAKEIGEYTRNFESLPAIAGFTGNPNTFHSRLKAEASP